MVHLVARQKRMINAINFARIKIKCRKRENWRITWKYTAQHMSQHTHTHTQERIIRKIRMDYHVDAKFCFLFIVATPQGIHFYRKRSKRASPFVEQTPQFLQSIAWHFTEEHIKNSKYSNSLLLSLVLNILSIVRSFIRSFFLSSSLSFRFLVHSDYRYSFNDASLLYTYLCFSG